MTTFEPTTGTLLMLSLHGYVAAEPELGKPDTGGQVVYVLELAKRFSRLGLRVDLVTRRFEGQPEVDVINDNFRIWRIPFGGPNFVRKEDMHDHLSDFVTNCLAAIRARGGSYTMVYSHYWDAGWAGQKIAEELNIAHVHTPHSLGWWKQQTMGEDMDEEEMEAKYRFRERVRKEFLVYQMSDHVIATTLPQAELLYEKYDLLEDHVTVVPPGMDEQRFSPVRGEEQARLQQQYGFGSSDVLALGRMAANKGYDLLIQALPTLVQQAPEARLVAAIGSADSEQDRGQVAELRQLAADCGVADVISWIDYVEDDDLVDFYRAASVFSLSSRYEPFGMVAIEAMACGTPAVITHHGGLFELIDFGHHALYADPHRPAEFGVMLSYPLLYPTLAHRLSVEGARFARRNFGWTGIAKRMLTIFDNVTRARQSYGLVT